MLSLVHPFKGLNIINSIAIIQINFFGCKNCNTLSDMLYWLCCPSPFWQQKGVDIMDTILTNFLVAVAAQVAAHFLCKWLESHRKGK